MATLTSEQLKDSYQSLVTIGDTITTDPTSGALENGKGTALTSFTIGDSHYIGSEPTFDNLLLQSSSGESINISSSNDIVLKTNAVNPSGTGTERMKINGSSGDISFRDTSTNEAFYWDADVARLGIGTTSPSAPLDIDANSTATNLVLRSRTGSDFSNINFNTDDASTTLVNIGSVGDSFRILTGGLTSLTERMRIDSSGNVLVGKTTTGLATVGHQLNNDGAAFHTKSSNTVMFLNRTTSDGTIVDLRKDNTTVGSIGAISGDVAMYSTTANHNGLRFALDAILPTDNAGLVVDNDADLGSSSYRFNDLYLGGSVYLGGTTSANALDDYEEGTFDLTLGGSTTDPTTPVVTTANYTKIGNVVHYNFRFDNVDTTGASGLITFSGFPFTTTSTNNAVGSVSSYSMADFNGAEYIDLYIGTSSTSGELLGSRTNNFWVSPQHNAGSGRYLQASITVHVV